MYNNKNFWIIASFCFIVSTIVYIIVDKAFTFRVGLNIFLVILSFIGFLVINKRNKIKSKTLRNNTNIKRINKK